MKLSQRLQAIAAMVPVGYDHIWDVACDHGLLGAALLARRAAAQIHFVDVVPELMRQLEHKLMRFYPPTATGSGHWQVHLMDAAALPLDSYNGRHLVIIAGVGGDLMAQWVAAICARHAGLAIDFLVCPVHHQFSLRQQLIELDCGLLGERLVAENQRYYEIIWVSWAHPAPSMAISPVGSLLWQAHTPEQSSIAADYLAQTLAHYQRMRLNANLNVEPIVAAYAAIKL